MTTTPTRGFTARVTGTDRVRVDADAKVRGEAPYAYEQHVDDPAYLYPLQSSIARGRVAEIDTDEAEALPGVLFVMTHLNAPRLASTEDGEYTILQGNGVAFRGQLVGAVVAETSEVARHASELVRIRYDVHEHDTELRADRTDLYEPDTVNPGQDTTSDDGGVSEALASAAATVDQRYSTPMEHNNPMEPHACVATWDAGLLTLFDSTQGSHGVRSTIAPLFDLAEEQVRVVSPYVGGGFGSKGLPHAHNVLVAMAAKLADGRPVKMAMTRQQMFTLAGYRTPTLQRVQLGADLDGHLVALSHEAVEQTSRVKEFAEQTTVISRVMYAADHRRTTHRLAALDVAVPSWMRAPGEAPGSFGLESAMDELADVLGIDPVELRVRNEPARDPETGRAWSSRHLVDCLQQGAERFGWSARQAPGTRREGQHLVGLGVAAATYPGFTMPGSVAEISHLGRGHYAVRIGAADIGTGTWTTLPQIAADALGCPVESVHLEIGSTDLPTATVEGGSSGISSWGSTVVAAVRAFRAEHGSEPAEGATTRGSSPAEDPDAEKFAVHSFGAHFVEVRVDVDTGEVRVPRMLGMFSCGRIVNPRTARSQFVGGMTFGISMALHEGSVTDHRLGHVVTHDLVDYHVPVNADVGDLQVGWLDEVDPHSNPMGTKGIGEIGIVGAAAAVANAVFNATGFRVRDLPITPDKLVTLLP